MEGAAGVVSEGREDEDEDVLLCSVGWVLLVSMAMLLLSV